MGLRICISYLFPGDADAARPQNTHKHQLVSKLDGRSLDPRATAPTLDHEGETNLIVLNHYESEFVCYQCWNYLTQDQTFL